MGFLDNLKKGVCNVYANELGLDLNDINITRCNTRKSDAELVILRKTYKETLPNPVSLVKEKLLSAGCVKAVTIVDNSVYLYLDRSWCLEQGLKSLLADTRKNMDELRSQYHWLLNVVDDISEKSSNDHSLNFLRSQLLAEHIDSLLIENSCSVFHDHSKDVMRTFFQGREERHLEESSQSTVTKMEQNVNEKTISADLWKAIKASPYFSEDLSIQGSREDMETKEGMDKTCSESNHHEAKHSPGIVDLKQFICDNDYTQGKKCYDKNINLVKIEDSSDSRLREVSKIIELSEKATQKAEHKDLYCLHIHTRDQDHRQQTIDLLSQISMRNEHISKQFHLIHGGVAVRKTGSSLSLPTAQEYLRKRRHQIEDAFSMKYPEKHTGAEWRSMVDELTVASVKFEMLTTSCSSQLHLDMREGVEADIGPGVFVMYNCARLATLQANFQKSIQQGRYPPLPAQSEVDFSQLKDKLLQEEWALFFDFVLPYEDLVTSALSDLDQSHLKVTIHTHKICQFLQSLSQKLSSYYSRTHILGEGKRHLLPVMFARIYLMKAIEQVYHHGLNLLNIKPMSQL